MKLFTHLASRTVVFGCITGLVILATLLVLASLVTDSRYVALTAAIQAAAVIPSITIAGLALTRDSRDKRVDRVLELHRELHSPDLASAKARLTVHLMLHGTDGKIRPASREELAKDPALSRYEADDAFSPRRDVDLILRFFERADVARIANSVESSLLVELIGRSAAWWNLVIGGNVDEVPRSHLQELAEWANNFAFRHKDRYSYLQNWGRNRDGEFGRRSPGPGEVPPTPAAP